MIECDKCINIKYIGETERKFKNRISEHKGYITNNIYTQPTGEHFNEPGHTLSDMKVIIIEKVRKNDTTYRKEREKFHIKQFNTYYNGLNKQP